LCDASVQLATALADKQRSAGVQIERTGTTIAGDGLDNRWQNGNQPFTLSFADDWDWPAVCQCIPLQRKSFANAQAHSVQNCKKCSITQANPIGSSALFCQVQELSRLLFFERAGESAFLPGAGDRVDGRAMGDPAAVEERVETADPGKVSRSAGDACAIRRPCRQEGAQILNTHTRQHRNCRRTGLMVGQKV